MSQRNIETRVFSGAFCQALEKEASSQLVISEQARCSQYYFGQSVETCGFFPKGGSFGCLLVQKFTKNSRMYHGWICYVIYFHFRVRLGVAWDWRSAKRVTSPFVFFQSFVCHPCELYDVFLLVASCH